MDFKFPDVGEGITEGKLVKWHVKEGDSIKSEATVASIETDKAVVDIPSPTSGVVEKLFFKAGDTVNVGKVLMTINNGETPIKAAQQESRPEPVQYNPAPASRQEYTRPAQSFQPIIEQRPEVRVMQPQTQIFQSSGSTILAMPFVRKYARDNGINLSSTRGTGAHGQILINDIHGISGATPSAVRETISFATPAQIQQPQSTQPQSPFQGYNDILATPSTRMLARQLGVDLTRVKGSGDHGMITKEDVVNYGKQVTSNPNPISSVPISNIPNAQNHVAQQRSVAAGVGSEVIPMSAMRQAISRKMNESMHMTAQYSVMDEIDVTELVKTRERYKESYEKQGIKLTYLPFIIKAVVNALIKHPNVNSNLDEANKQIILKHYYNIGIATDTPEGLIVPVVKGADAKSIITLSKELLDITSRARERKLRLDEMDDGTFTISSLGNNFGQGFTPIINYPEVAIMGIGRIVEKPAVFNGQIIPRKLMTLSLTADHRIIDGAEASRFMNDVKAYLEDLNLLLMELN